MLHWLKLTAICLASSSLALDQHPLTQPEHNSDGKLELVEKLREAEIIPSILDAFVPSVQIAAAWTNVSAALGNTLDPQDLQQSPTLDLVHWYDDSSSQLLSKHKHTQITLALTDPDAPSHDDPKWSQVCHWLVTRVPLDDDDHDLETSSSTTTKGFKDIIEYKAPGPPPRTGLHRYVFVALAPLNGTTKKLHLSTPADRRHWGYDDAGAGVKEWAREHGLVPIGANFIYAQNSEQ